MQASLADSILATYIVEPFKRNGAEMPQIMYTFAHPASSIDLMRERVYYAMNSINWFAEVIGFCIVSGEGIPLYEWPKT